MRKIKSYNFSLIIFSILVYLFFNQKSFANEPLVKYDLMYRTDQNGQRVIESDPKSYEDATIVQNSVYGDLNLSVPRFGPKGTTVDPNKPKVGFIDDCYPDSEADPKGNIVFSGKVYSNITNNPINGAVVAVYMGAENTYNLPDVDHYKDSGDSSSRRFVVGGKDRYGRLTNLYYYDITKDGMFTVYACNDYKSLSTSRLSALAQVNPVQFGPNRTKPLPEGYTQTGTNSIYFDYSIPYPKFNIAVICGFVLTADKKNMSPIIGEIYSITNYNDEYKQPSRPSYMKKTSFDIRVNCNDSIPPFTVPMNLDYSSPANVASCRMDDISPNLVSYMNSVRAPFRNRKIDTLPEKLTVPNATVIPNFEALPECTPGDMFCLKNFLTLAIPKPNKDLNVFDYQEKTFLDPDSVPDKIKEQSFTYTTAVIDRKVDLDNTNISEPNFIPWSRNSTKGQLDAKIDLSTAIDDFKFDISSLRQLYGCFTTLNSPNVQSSAYVDDLIVNDINVVRQSGNAVELENRRAAYTNNIRIPSCRELFCASQVNPDKELCKFPRNELLVHQQFFKLGNIAEFPDHPRLYYVMNSTLGYGPAVTLSTLTHEEITKNFMILAKQLINSDFNPKATHPNPTINAKLNYKPVTNIGEVPGCFNDQGNLVYLNGPSSINEGSITYTLNGNTTTFYSPVPLLSFISIPYSMELYHANIFDNYKNMNSPVDTPFFPEECDITSPTDKKLTNQKFANCRKAVLPGGVYSLSALAIISKMCSDAVKVPIANFGNFDLKSVKGIAYDNKRETLYKGYIEIEPNVTKIGSVQSLCLCEPGDAECNLKTYLNNAYDETPAFRRYEGMTKGQREKVIGNFAVSSLVGDGDQTEGKNFLGVLCKNKFTDNSRQANPPADPCESRNLSNYDGDSNGYTIDIQDSNKFVANSNIRVTWPFSYKEIGRAPDKYEFLVYQWKKDNPKSNDPIVNSRVKAYKPNGGTVNLVEYQNEPKDKKLDTLVEKWGQCDFNKISDVYLYDGSMSSSNGVSPTEIYSQCNATTDPNVTINGFNFECSKSKKEKRCTQNKSLEVISDAHYVSDITVVDKEFDEKTRIRSQPYIEGNSTELGMKVVQETSDGTTGSLKAKFTFQHAIYNPVPQILNAFRDFATYAKVPGINNICRAPKIGAVMDIRVRELDYSSRSYLSTKPSNALGGIENYTAGLHCNSYIPEEMERCEGPNYRANMDPTWLQAAAAARLTDDQTREFCKAKRCKILCEHLYTKGNYYFYGEMLENLDTPQYYCRNLNPTKGIEMQINRGDEGCVLDYVNSMKQMYAVPFSNNEGVEYNVDDQRLNKQYYPVFNNNLCEYPNVNQIDPNVPFDKGNCAPFMKTLLDNFRRDTENPVSIPIGGGN